MHDGDLNQGGEESGDHRRRGIIMRERQSPEQGWLDSAGPAGDHLHTN
jgi:hypothetical protein